MRFGLLGDHRDGLDFAFALAASERHQLILYGGQAPGLLHLQRHGLVPRAVTDLEELLADAELDAVIVASGPSVRAAHLRRAMQSDCHVVCVHPADPSPDIAYEAGLIQADTGRVLLPLLPMALHPGFRCARDFARSGRPRVIELEIWSTEEALLDAGHEGHKMGLPAWDVLRYVGGEIAEVYLQASQAELLAGQPILLSGRFTTGVLFQATLVPHQADARFRLSLLTNSGRASLSFALGWPSQAEWFATAEDGDAHIESFEPFHPWRAFLEHFDRAVQLAALKKPAPGQIAEASLTKEPPLLGWQDELRALELDDAARRSAERGRSSTLDLQEATEEASFKGVMTLAGCSLIWLAVVGLILSVWVNWLLWVIVPLFAVFLLMQSLRWVMPGKDSVPPVQPERDGKA